MKLRPAATALSERLFMLFIPAAAEDAACIRQNTTRTAPPGFYGHSCPVWYFITFPAILVYLHNCILFFLRYKPVKYAAVIPFGRRLSPPAAVSDT